MEPPAAPAGTDARRAVLVDGIFSRLMDALTGGLFLAGLGVYLGANNFTISLLAALPAFAQVAQLPAIQLLLRVQDRRRIVVWASALSRSLLFVIAALVYVFDERLPAPILLALLTIMAAFAVVSGAAWNWWMRDVIPRGELGRYFGRRLRITSAIAVASTMAASYFLDRLEAVGRAGEGYALLWFVGGVCGMVSVAILARTPHPEPQGPRFQGRPLRLMLDSLRDPSDRRLALALMLVAGMLTLALPFTAVYLLRGLEYSFLAVASLALVNQVAYVGSLRGWGHLSDRFGNRALLLVSVGMGTVALLGWSVAWRTTGLDVFVYLALLHFVTGYAVGGIDLTSGNVLLKNAPTATAPAYLAAMSLARALAAAAITVVGGLAWFAVGDGTLVEWEPLPGVTWRFRGFHMLTLASAACGLAALLVLRRVREEGGAPVADVARAMRREVRMLSSVAGIRAFVHVVSYVVEFVAEPPRPRRRGRARRDEAPVGPVEPERPPS